MPLLFRSILAAHMSSLGKHGVVAELSFAKRGQSTPLTAISLSSDQRHAVVGGHGIMKVRMHVLCAPVDASVFGFGSSKPTHDKQLPSTLNIGLCSMMRCKSAHGAK